MPIVNGKIVRSKSKTKKVVEDKPKSKTKKKVSEKKKNIIQEGFDTFKKEAKIEKPKKSKKKSKEDFIRTGENSAIKIETSEFYGKEVVAIRKMYCTKADPEMKIGKGGFNLPADREVLESVIGALQDLLDEM
ncbi:hypothetical protein JA33_114 [Dickeya phage vB_DsoM_JA33]|uniref:Uncharacterized protein n=2 Tax=Salmondvirus JA11 TaxID=2734141 RepID=A0A386K665_9CAUD|nr:hypothetical protein HOU32_gp114 [Dickeya phage vB_DsoM_JA11]AXG67488.1 hypothetical protein JA33_114 [Dickeya phage vB_DsoM_JA33]AYD79919.1 hypothetical protein JA11_114 [Dickeya phage vB_DsoM_JA11]